MSPVFGYAFNLFLVLVLVFCNAFFVVSEFAIVKIRRTKLEELAHGGSKRAKIALKINEHMNTYLSAIQLGITLASLGLGWLGEPAVSRLLEDLFSDFFADNKLLLHSLINFSLSVRRQTLRNFSGRVSGCRAERAFRRPNPPYGIRRNPLLYYIPDF